MDRIAELCEARIHSLEVLKGWLDGSLVGNAVVVPGDAALSAPAPEVALVIATTLCRTSYAHGPDASARAFCQAMLEVDHWSGSRPARQQPGDAASSLKQRNLSGPDPRSRGPMSPTAVAHALGGAASSGGAAVAAASDVVAMLGSSLTGGRRAAAGDTAGTGFAGLYPDGLARRPRGDTIRPSLRRGPRGEAVFEWLGGWPPGEGLGLRETGVAACEAASGVYRRLRGLDSADDVTVSCIEAADARVERLLLRPLAAQLTRAASEVAASTAATVLGGASDPL